MKVKVHDLVETLVALGNLLPDSAKVTINLSADNWSELGRHALDQVPEFKKAGMRGVEIVLVPSVARNLK